jgi:hypothetical protein
MVTPLFGVEAGSPGTREHLRARKHLRSIRGIAGNAGAVHPVSRAHHERRVTARIFVGARWARVVARASRTRTRQGARSVSFGVTPIAVTPIAVATGQGHPAACRHGHHDRGAEAGEPGSLTPARGRHRRRPLQHCWVRRRLRAHRRLRARRPRRSRGPRETTCSPSRLGRRLPVHHRTERDRSTPVQGVCNLCRTSAPTADRI